MQTLVISITDRPNQSADYQITLHQMDSDELRQHQEQSDSDQGSGPESSEHGPAASGSLSRDQVAGATAAIAGLLTSADSALVAGASAEEAGRTLYRLLISTNVGQRWAELCGMIRSAAARGAASGAMRTYLDFEPDEIAALPWELMLAGDDHPIFLTRRHRVLRGRPEPATNSPVVPLTLPIRVLIVLCRQRDSRDAVINAANEADGVYAGLRSQPGIWQIEVLRGPSEDDLIKRLEDLAPHILHIVGDTVPPDSQEFVVDTQPEDRRWRLAIDDLLVTRLDGPPPRLLILDGCVACQAMPSEALRNLGTRAVVTMHPQIHSAHSENLTKIFYEKLAEKGALEEAIWRTRRAVKSQEDSGVGEWAKPVLTVYGPPEEVILTDLQTLGQLVDRLTSNYHYKDTARQVDRVYEHMRIRDRESGYPDEKLIIVHGMDKTGKTQLVRSCMLTWQLRSCRTVLVDMREAALPDDDQARENLDAQAALLHLCRRLIDKLEDWDRDAGTSLAKDRDDLADLAESILTTRRDRSKRDGEPLEEQFNKLHDIFAAITLEDSLLLMLDHLEKITDDGQRLRFSDGVMRPIERGVAWNASRFGQLYGIVAMTTAALTAEVHGRSILQSLEGSVKLVEVKYFHKCDTKVLGRELGARLGWLEAGWHELVEWFYQPPTGDLKPVDLVMLMQLYKARTNL